MSENNKLTLTDIMLYPNAKVEYVDDVYEIIMIHKYNEMVAIRRIVSGTYQIHTADIYNCKLILRPLSSLTEEETENISFDIYDYDDGDELLDSTETKMFIDDIDYFRSINIDIDNLQERGVAVYEY